MAAPRKRSRKAPPGEWQVTVDYKLLKDLPVDIGEGFAAPRRFTVVGAMSDPHVGPLDVEVVVEVVDNRARARTVSVRTDRPGGVSSTTLRAVPIRDLMSLGLAQTLLAVELTATGAHLTPVAGKNWDERALATVKRVVGYDPEVRP